MLTFSDFNISDSNPTFPYLKSRDINFPSVDSYNFETDPLEDSNVIEEPNLSLFSDKMDANVYFEDLPFQLDEILSHEPDAIINHTIFNEPNLMSSIPFPDLASHKTPLATTEINRIDEMPNLRSYAALANIAYCSKKRIQLSPNVYVRIQGNGNAIYLLFSGSETNLEKYIYEQKTLTDYENIPGAQVHLEFYREFIEAKPALLSKIKPNIKAQTKTFLIGHGLGGVFAVLAALAINEQPPKVSKPDVYTFGSPRIGNRIFADYSKERLRLIRTTLRNDDVPRQPVIHNYFIFFGNKYTHFGAEYWIKNTSLVFYCTPTTGQYESKKCLNKEPVTSLAYHDGPYFRVLMKNCTGISSLKKPTNPIKAENARFDRISP
ncbi:hypothetical protein G9A89_015063 [Geosiphon pyriformis]|nr:hypothetical protein G9A89_015063 [Geosiphon pyriformis]